VPITQAARIPTRQSPETLEAPPCRGRCPTATYAQRRPAAEARISISRFQP
jgi:hypothetical protein